MDGVVPCNVLGPPEYGELSAGESLQRGSQVSAGQGISHVTKNQHSVSASHCT